MTGVQKCALPIFCQAGKALDEDGLLLRLSSPEKKQEMMKALAGKYDIDEIKVFEPSLNDIFVEYTGEQA